MRMLGASGPAAPLVGRPVDQRSVVGEAARRGRTVICEDYAEFGSANDARSRVTVARRAQWPSRSASASSCGGASAQ